MPVRLVVSLLLFAVFAEAAALAVHYAGTGWLFYANPHRRVLAVLPPDAQQTLTGDALHPYFGPTHRPGLVFEIPAELQGGASPGRPPARTNNFGFVARTDYPVPRGDDRQFFVGFFGGSVGLWFCEVGAERFLDRLRRHPALAGRTIVPVCLAHEGYKQPQQLLTLAYFLSAGQPFDLVVNIDGFNEVALGAMNDQRGFDFTMPSVSHIEPLMNLIDRATLTPDKAEALAAINTARQAADRWARRANAARLAAVYLVADRMHAIADARYRDARLRFDRLPSQGADRSLLRITPRTAERSGDAFFAGVARQWAEASGAMQALLAARGIAYVHVLQPNQYASVRRFSDAERQVAFIDASPFKPGAEQGYPHLRGEAAQRILRERGVRFVDGSGAFDRTPGQVYWDNCCHYTRLGNDVLADVIADAVLAPGVLPAR
ncbi:MAG: hypothetical protein AB7I25_09735 [Vicinamibacterales bacterium]